jgi:hypothetical protein
VPSISLPATDETTVDLSALAGLVVVYAYPRTGIPGVENPPGWDVIPGARGWPVEKLVLPQLAVHPVFVARLTCR